MLAASPREARGGARLPALDALRGVAILLVLVHHMEGYGALTWRWPLPLLYAALKDGGWIGVDLFFVLSGFLVSGLIFREYQRRGTVGLGRFLVRRGLKIYPAFYLLLATTILIDAFLQQPTPSEAILREAVFLQNYGPSLWPHTWSLAVEEHFYLLLALGLYLGSRRTADAGNPFRPLLALAPAVALLALAGRLLTLYLSPQAFRSVLNPTHLRIDSLLFGVVLSYLHHFDGACLERRVSQNRLWLLVLSLGLLLPAFVLDVHRSVFMRSFGLTGLYLGCGGVLLLSLHGARSRPAWARPCLGALAAVGTYSYSIYLWHFPVKVWLAPLLRLSFAPHLSYGPRQIAYLGECLVVGIVMGKLVEAPVLALRDRFLPSRSPGLSLK